MSKFTLLHETPDHFVLHNGKASFHIAKKGIAEPTADKIRSFANGGRTTAGDITQKENQKNMHKIDKNIASAKRYTDGGMTESPEEAGIEAVAQKHAGQSNASDTETEIEAAEQQRRANEKTQPTDYVKYNNPDKFSEGGNVTEDSVQQDNLWTGLKNAFSAPEAKTQPDQQQDREQQYKKIRETNTQNMETGNYSKGGYVHHNAGKNQIHLHFYDGAVVPTQLDKEEGAGPQQASPLDKYVGGEPQKLAEGGETQSSDSDKLAQAAQEIQQNTDTQNTAIADASADQAATPETPEPIAQEAAAPVPQAQQIPAVQKPLPTTPVQQPQMLSDLDKSLALEKQGIQEGANAQSEGYKATAQAVGQNVLEQKARIDAWKLEADKITQQNEQIYNAVASSKVDPNHFWNNKSTGGKIAATIGVLLGGIAGGADGSNNNKALATMQNQIQQDIDAQKTDTSNKMNLYKMGLERYRDAQSAQQFATLQSNALLQGTLSKIAAQTGNVQAQASAHQMIGQIGVQNAGIRSELAMKQAAFSSMNQTPSAQAGVDPNKLRLLITAGIIPKEEVPTAMKEYGEYQKLSNSLDEVDSVFKQARQDSTYTQRAAEAIPGGSMLPTMRDSTKNFQAETNSLLDKYTKDLTGRVTPQSMENLRHSIPLAGDSPDVFNRKLQTFKDIVREAYSFPTLTTARILNPNNPVTQSTATRNKKFSESKPK